MVEAANPACGSALFCLSSRSSLGAMEVELSVIVAWTVMAGWRAWKIWTVSVWWSDLSASSILVFCLFFSFSAILIFSNEVQLRFRSCRCQIRPPKRTHKADPKLPTRTKVDNVEAMSKLYCQTEISFNTVLQVNLIIQRLGMPNFVRSSLCCWHGLCRMDVITYCQALSSQRLLCHTLYDQFTSNYGNIMLTGRWRKLWIIKTRI